VPASAGATPADEHFHTLFDRADSDLERRFLELLAVESRRLPSSAQKLIEDADCRPDFLYDENMVAVFIDGPHHDSDEQRQADEQANARLEDLGWEVIRLRYDEDWSAVINHRKDIFGAGVVSGAAR
jgi:very-short-patch-repair endonuclease